MKVKATRIGYYAHIRIREGQKFRLKDPKEFSEHWMEKLSKNAKVDEVVVHEQPKVEPSIFLDDDAEDNQSDADSNSEVI